MITVAGGIYRELCVTPAVDEIFGSAGRAAVAIAGTATPVELHAYCPSSLQNDVRSSLEGTGAQIFLTDSSAQVLFRYLHPLARPVFEPSPPPRNVPLSIRGTTVVRFGMMEGDAVVHAERAIYDPQSAREPFRQNGSTAESLAMVLNTTELEIISGVPAEADAISRLLRDHGASIVVVKAGAVGARVYENGLLLGTVSPYETERVYKIGSGDIFTAAFAHAWCNLSLSPLESADYASRSAAHYCETRSTTLLAPASLGDRKPIRYVPGRQVYIAAPFFTTSDLWLVEELWRALRAVGSSPFSPYHDIGLGKPEIIAPADLQALEQCSAILAIVSHCDPGTLFEVGYAVSKNIPVIALAENPRVADLSMLEGTGCFITSDLSTAVYRAAWASWR